MDQDTPIFRDLALYYAVGVILAAVIFRLYRAWRQRRSDEDRPS